MLLSLPKRLCFNPDNLLSSPLKEMFLESPTVLFTPGPYPLLPSAFPSFSGSVILGFSSESRGSIQLGGAKQWFKLKPHTFTSPEHASAFLMNRPLPLGNAAGPGP